MHFIKEKKKIEKIKTCGTSGSLVSWCSSSFCGYFSVGLVRVVGDGTRAVRVVRREEVVHRAPLHVRHDIASTNAKAKLISRNHHASCK